MKTEHKWRVEKPTRNRGHARARLLYPLDGVTCEACDEVPALDRHHIDGNTANNERENVRLLCRRCHMLEDGRLKQLAAQAADAGKLGGNPHGRENAPRDSAGRFLSEAAA